MSHRACVQCPMDNMKITLLCAALAGAPLWAQLPPEIPYESVPDYFKYPSEMNLGEMAAVAVNSKGHLFMLSRSGLSGPLFGTLARQLLEFDETDKFVILQLPGVLERVQTVGEEREPVGEDGPFRRNRREVLPLDRGYLTAAWVFVGVFFGIAD